MIFPDSLVLALAAILIEALVGYPDWLYRLIGHPMTWIGRVVVFGEARLNRLDLPPEERRNRGMFLLVAVLMIVGFLSILIAAPLSDSLPGAALLACLGSAFLAQRSLYVQVRHVATGLDRSLEDGRAALAQISGRDVDTLDAAGVSRAAIDSLSENFPTGIVGPTLAMALFGLPGAALCVAVNTIAGLIAHPTPRYMDFGAPALKLEYAMNWLIVRICAGLLMAGALLGLRTSARNAWRVVQRETASPTFPDAAWPQAAFAGALGLKLGGPRAYGGRSMPGDWIGEDHIAPDSAAIRRALSLYLRAFAVEFAALALFTLLLL